MKKINLLCGVLLLIAFWGCQNQSQKNQYQIGSEAIGPLTKSTTVGDLERVFEGDSVVHKEDSRRFSNADEFVIYSGEDGRELLRLKPQKDKGDSRTIATVQVMDTIYRTARGLGIGSTFEKLSEHYDIDKIENTLGTAMIFLKDNAIYLDIDKEEIYEPTQMGVELKASQIKRKAKIKHLWLDWEK